MGCPSVSRSHEEALAEAILEDCRTAFPALQLKVTGTCMEPTLHAGDSIVVDPRSPRFGEVVLVRLPAGLRLHRLVWRPWRGRWRTKADRSATWDPSVERAAVLGTVESSETLGHRYHTAFFSLLGGFWTRVTRRH